MKLVKSDDICVVKKVQRLHNKAQLSMLTNLEDLQHPQIKLDLADGKERVAAKPEGTRRQRKCSATVRVESSQWVDRPAAPV